MPASVAVPHSISPTVAPRRSIRHRLGRVTEKLFCLVTGLLVFLASGLLASVSAAAEPNQPQARVIDFSRDVQPILAKHCLACHGPDDAEGGLRFSDRETAFGEAESGMLAIVPGDAAASHLIERVTSGDEHERMPPEGDRLTASQVSVLRDWIDQGAPWSDHWAFEPVRDIPPPVVANELWNQNPIDAFIFDSVSAAGLQPNPTADRATLIRRAYYDLTGLPPTLEEVNTFVNDQDPEAFSKLVDRLLQSHHYGEHWGRYWLDLVRYAETNSFERDGLKPNAWKYRDYVIKSFNDDKPYDRFVREQLAGDELDQVTPETLTATGYYRLGIWDDEPADRLQARFDEFDDIITTTGQVFLALTINCARCHDHKIDPIPQKDYYGMLAFLADVTPWSDNRGNTAINNQIDVSSDELNRKYQANDAERSELQAEMTEIEQVGIAKMSGPDQRATEGPKKERDGVLKKHLQSNLDESQWSRYESLREQLKAVDAARDQLPPREMVMGLARCEAKPKQTFVLFRGNPHSPADPVEPSFPSILDSTPPSIPPADESQRSAGRRRVLADWITSPENRLSARVIVNRIWQYHFGRGIVRSSNNFGQLGTQPTHPELLDYLAGQMIDRGWSFKSMHRLIMNSRAYQMSSASAEPAVSIDPNNDLFWRFDPRRLRAEEVRDSILAGVGVLNREPYGPSFYSKLSQEVLAGQSRPGAGWGNSDQRQRDRRSVYIHVKRSLLTPLLSAFDFPDPDLTCEERFATLQPGQALALLNGDFAHEQARRLAENISAADATDAEVVERTVRSMLQREATEDEITAGVSLIRSLITDHALPRSRAVELHCLSVMNWNEFLFLD